MGPQADGCCAVLPRKAKVLGGAKLIAQLVEAFLLKLGKNIGRRPWKNRHPGFRDRLMQIIANQKGLRFHISGRHPLIHPDRPQSKLSKPVSCTIHLTEDLEILIDSPWARRRRRRVKTLYGTRV